MRLGLLIILLLCYPKRKEHALFFLSGFIRQGRLPGHRAKTARTREKDWPHPLSKIKLDFLCQLYALRQKRWDKENGDVQKTP